MGFGILSWLKKEHCWWSGHPYLPVQRVVKHHSGEMREVDCLVCPLCGKLYRFAFDEYWHCLSDRVAWLDAHGRQTVKGGQFAEQHKEG